MPDRLSIPAALHRFFVMHDKMTSTPTYRATVIAKAKHLAHAQGDARDIGLALLDLAGKGFYDEKGLVQVADNKEYTDEAVMCMTIMRELKERTGLSMAKLGEQVDRFVDGQEVKVPYFANKKDNYMPLLDSKTVMYGDTLKVRHDAFSNSAWEKYNGMQGTYTHSKYGTVHITFEDGSTVGFDPEKVWHVL